jgi:hypothetical protein
VYAQDPAGRDEVVTLIAFRDFQQVGIDLITPNGESLLNNPLLAGIMAVIDAEERRKFKKRSRGGMRRVVRAGGWVGRPVPYGHRAEVERGSAALRPSEVEIVPGLSEPETIRCIFGMLDSGKTCREVPGDLSTRGIRDKARAERWSAISVSFGGI